MQTNDTPEAGRSFAQRILAELQAMRQELDATKMELAVLNECATLLLRPWEGEALSPLQAMMRSMEQLVSGTAETHKRIEALSAAMFDSRMTSALRASMEM